jgi:diguanylate cyclase (GGDEF)-like protein
MTTQLPKISGSPEEILDHLLEKSELSGFELALYDDQGHLLAVRCGPQGALCGAAGNMLCQDDCPRKRNGRINPGEGNSAPQLTTCPCGLWHYRQPCLTEEGDLQSLVIGGVRTHDINLPYLETLAQEKGLSASSLLEYWESIPAVSERDMLETGRMVRQSIFDRSGTLQAASRTSGALTSLTSGLIKAVAETESGLSKADSPAAILDLLAEALTPHFSPGQIALFLPKGEGQPSNWVFPEKGGAATGQPGAGKNAGLTGSSQTTCLPLLVQHELFGCLVLHAALPSTADHQLLKIIADRIACRLEQLKNPSTSDRQTAIPAEYLLNRLEILGTNRELRDLCRQILETAAQLSKAGKGSLMLADGTSGKLRILASIGMNREMAEEMSARGDQSISGLVLESGQPLLVKDLTKDQRIKIAPRPRFRTRSLLSLPLRAHKGLLGVLNLSDKWDNTPFNESDLTLLSTWAGYCAPLIERLATSQTFDQLKQNTAVDPLTGAYSPTVLEKRFAEEVSRSIRCEQDLILMLVAPDLKEGRPVDRSASREDEKATVQTMRDLLRKMDIVGRLASGTLAVLLPDTHREGAMIVAERLRLTVEKQHADRQLTISCGLAHFPRHGSTFAALVRSAETALKQARSEEGNSTLFFDQIKKNNKIVFI